MSDIAAFVYHALATHDPDYRVIKANYNGKTIWIKQNTNPKRKIWHHLQSLLTALIPLPVFRPTVSNADALQQEAQRLRLFKEKNIPVPDVLYSTDRVFALSDAGTPLRDILSSMTDPADRQLLLEKTMLALVHLHQAGLCHGRPLPKDMLWQDGEIIFIDLEENPLSVMSLAQAQARDVWLFLNGCVRYLKTNPDALERLYALYAGQISSATLHELKIMVRWLRPIRFIAEHLIMPFAGNDVRKAVIVNKMLEKAVMHQQTETLPNCI
jgi:tRNA A-37 threonylcarbamoyl transferase component Bud32